MSVQTPHGLEAYGVLVAPTGDLWRSRIMTYPNILWAAPGGNVTIKFAAASAQDAEARAIAFIEGHIASLGYRKYDSNPSPVVSRHEAEARAIAAASPALRKLKAIPVRFGIGAETFKAMTGNLSQSGLFVVTLAPLDPGAGLRVVVDLNTGPVGLIGHVAWKRQRPILGRPVGIGVALRSPPEIYREFVVELP